MATRRLFPFRSSPTSCCDPSRRAEGPGPESISAAGSRRPGASGPALLKNNLTGRTVVLKFLSILSVIRQLLDILIEICLGSASLCIFLQLCTVFLGDGSEYPYKYYSGLYLCILCVVRCSPSASGSVDCIWPHNCFRDSCIFVANAQIAWEQVVVHPASGVF